MATSIDSLPNEVLQQILCYLPPLSIPAFQLVNQRFSRLLNGIIWRHFCKHEFNYWKPEHCITAKFSGNVDRTDWKTLFVHRHRVDRFTSATLDSILSSQMGRIEKFQQILDHGYDAKDTLLRHLAVSNDAEDVLARRYYSDAILGCLHRNMAIEEWSHLQNRGTVSMERVLGAYDMFVLHDRSGDFDEISRRFDELAKTIEIETPRFHESTTRQKSLAILRYLRDHDLTGLGAAQNYRDLQNNFIGIALLSDEHASLPLISTAIFCCVAQRLGINAAACAFPFHVITVVQPPAGLDVDGSVAEAETASAPIYLDPFGSSIEVDIRDLMARLESLRPTRATYDEFLTPTSLEEVVLRTGRNIIRCVQDLHQHSLARQTVANAPEWTPSSSFPDVESAFYSALWASLMLGVPPHGDGPAYHMPRRDFLPHIVEQLEMNFPMDVGLIERYILPLFLNTGEFSQLRESVRVIRSVDSMPKAVKQRSSEFSRRVRYRIGQVFVHKRYHYQAVITGWDVECDADEHWMLRMRVHELSKGKQQSFYHVLVEDKSVRYVAEENIDLITGNVSPGLMNLAGRYFKRWDSTNLSFISNIRDEYPDD